MLSVSDKYDSVNEHTQEISELMKLHTQGVWQNADEFIKQLAHCSIIITRPVVFKAQTTFLFRKSLSVSKSKVKCYRNFPGAHKSWVPFHVVMYRVSQKNAFQFLEVVRWIILYIVLSEIQQAFQQWKKCENWLRFNEIIVTRGWHVLLRHNVYCDPWVIASITTLLIRVSGSLCASCH